MKTIGTKRNDPLCMTMPPWRAHYTFYILVRLCFNKLLMKTFEKKKNLEFYF